MLYSAELQLPDSPSLSELDSDPARWPALEPDAIDPCSRTASSPDPVSGYSTVVGPVPATVPNMVLVALLNLASAVGVTGL